MAGVLSVIFKSPHKNGLAIMGLRIRVGAKLEQVIDMTGFAAFHCGHIQVILPSVFH